MDDKGNNNGLFDSTMSLGDHLEELRARIILALIGLIVGVVICLILGKYIFAFVEKPYNDIAGKMELPSLLILGPAEGFVSYMKVTLVAGLIVSSPWVFYQIWMFVATGLYPNEKKYIYTAIPFSVALFITGALFFMFVVAPLTFGFLIKFNKVVLEATNSFTLQKYVTFVTTLMLVFGIAFQTPIAIFCLIKTGLVSMKALAGSRKFVILAMFIVSAVVTPPDVISQVTLAIPLYLLFELGFLLGYLSIRKEKRSEENK